MSNLYNDPDDFDFDLDEDLDEEQLDEFSIEELEDFMMSKDYEQLDELSKKTLGSYVKKATSDVGLAGFVKGVTVTDPTRSKEYDQAANMNRKRKVGIDKAVNKLTKEAYTGSYGRPKKQKKDELGDLLRLRAQERKDAGEAPEKHDARYLARNKPATRRSGQEHDDMQVTRESIQGMIETILSGNLVESTQSFTDIISSKIAARLEESKIGVAQRVFGIQESHDDDDDNDHDDYSKTISKMKKPKEDDDYKDEKHAEVDDDSFSKSLHGKLKTAEDIDDNPLSDDEKENPDDKRVQAGLAARAAKGEMSKPNAHRDIDLRQGSVTLQHGDAKRINSFMAGLKPQKRQEVMAHMQKSPKHFDAVHDVVKKFPAPKQNTSIYKDPRS
jgi:hypothetical protein